MLSVFALATLILIAVVYAQGRRIADLTDQLAAAQSRETCERTNRAMLWSQLNHLEAKVAHAHVSMLALADAWPVQERAREVGGRDLP